MRRTLALIIAVGLMAALLALPGAAVGRAAFTEYTATEIQIEGPNLDPAPPWTKPIVQARFTSVFEDDATDPRASGTTYVSGKITLTDPVTGEKCWVYLFSFSVPKEKSPVDYVEYRFPDEGFEDRIHTDQFTLGFSHEVPITWDTITFDPTRWEVRLAGPGGTYSYVVPPSLRPNP